MDVFDAVQGLVLGGFWASIVAFFIYRHERHRGAGDRWAGLVMQGLFARLGFALLHLWIGLSFYGGALDFTGYHASAISAGESYLDNPVESLGELFGREFLLKLLGLLYLLTGSSIVGMFLLSGLLAFLGSYLFLRAFQISFPGAGAHTKFLALALFFLPSFGYWSSLLGKESWIIFFLGLTTYSYVRVLNRFSIAYAAALVGGLLATTLIRGPVGVLAALALGMALCFSGKRRGPAAVLRPIVFVLVVAGALATGASISELLVGRPLSVESYVNLAVTVHLGMGTDVTDASASNLPPVVIEPTIMGVLKFLPEGMFTFLFRPLIFEAHHALALVAALDGTLLMVLILWRRRNLAASMKTIFSRPYVGFCLAILLTLSAGLALERNFGAIVRHRSMVLPFLLTLLAVPPSTKRRAAVTRATFQSSRSEGRESFHGTPSPAR